MNANMYSYLVYEGEYLNVEFYFDKNGSMPAMDSFVLLENKDQAAFIARVQRLADLKPGIVHPYTVFNLEDVKEKIYAIKFGNNRFCSFFYERGKIIITNAYKKQSQKNTTREKNEIKKSIVMKKDYESRVKKKAYYANEEIK